MKICPKCEYEYEDNITNCSDCGSELISLEEFNKNLVNPEDWEVVYSCSEEYEAEMIKANLEGAEIDSLIKIQKDSSFPAVGDLSIIKVLVKKEDVEAAEEIIEDINNKSDDTEEEEEQ